MDSYPTRMNNAVGVSQHAHILNKVRDIALIVLYGTTIFLGAGLVFLMEPMIVKMVLPSFGGSPAVWNTSLVFFQLMMLLGYGYAHLSTKMLGVKRQTLTHVVLLGLPLLLMPVALPSNAAPPDSVSPLLWLLLVLVVSIGLPFFVVATASPLIQRWFTNLDHRASADPYFLYAASNAGSLLALVGYPLVIEPNLNLSQQSQIWTALYVVFAALCGVCVLTVVSQRSSTSDAEELVASDAHALEHAPTRMTRLHWIALAFIPSSLMVGVSNYMATDVASVPLLWMLPLGVYLVTFILAFSHKRIVSLKYATAALPIVAVLGLAANPVILPLPIILLIVLHVGLLFVVSFVAHSRLADERPAASHLTEFYLVMSVGGVLGGAFNALLAPVLFDAVVEYPIMIAVSLLLAPLAFLNTNRQRDWLSRLTERTSMVRMLVGAVVLGMAVVGTYDGVLRWTFVLALGLIVAVIAGANALVVILRGIQKLPLFYVVAAVIVLFLPMFLSQSVVYAERTFFGVLQVRDVDDNRRILKHGTTIHGMQDFSSEESSREPLSYYSRSGPAGQVFDQLQRAHPFQNIGAIGLGTGVIAAYGAPGQTMTFFEIDPAVTRIALDPRYFTYLEDSAATIRTVNGDGRLELEDVPDGTYDLLILDAFSSDAIPTHLLTREAFELYRRKVTPGGAIFVHISNRNLELEPVVGAIARDLGMSSLTRDATATAEQAVAGVYDSHWCVLSMSPETLSPLAGDGRWRPLAADADVWTDEFSNIVGTLRWLK